MTGLDVNEYFQFKVGYFVDSVRVKEHAVLCDAWVDGDVFKVIENCNWPEGWTPREFDIVGCSGQILIFEVDRLPIAEDLEIVNREILIACGGVS